MHHCRTERADPESVQCPPSLFCDYYRLALINSWPDPMFKVVACYTITFDSQTSWFEGNHKSLWIVNPICLVATSVALSCVCVFCLHVCVCVSVRPAKHPVRPCVCSYRCVQCTMHITHVECMLPGWRSAHLLLARFTQVRTHPHTHTHTHTQLGYTHVLRVRGGTLACERTSFLRTCLKAGWFESFCCSAFLADESTISGTWTSWGCLE